MKLDEICANGANLGDRKNCPAGIAFQSLKIGLNAYFATYREMKYALHMFERGEPPEAIDINTSLRYYELSAETILHLHHFTELVIKDLLRTVHPLMADTASTEPVILKKLLKGQTLTDQENVGLKSIEFAEALDRLVTLINERHSSKGVVLGQ